MIPGGKAQEQQQGAASGVTVLGSAGEGGPQGQDGHYYEEQPKGSGAHHHGGAPGSGRGDNSRDGHGGGRRSAAD
ncbi:hypothetical protein [Streptomyces sp. KMM 9044]|uniref:hypothetical protein n=1 Tax=Streptomyces sp. KMM 9044 TaxID=2744474 RepID=UPI0022B23FBA|nr:hypothetical protein [Streptomyces sp. KMM 9044]WAX78773.1 hypothetical protein HUV60_014865 [Streptomyces sp. KMM 9044]